MSKFVTIVLGLAYGILIYACQCSVSAKLDLRQDKADAGVAK